LVGTSAVVTAAGIEGTSAVTITSTLTGALNATGGPGADNITGGAGNDVLSGGNGADTLSGDLSGSSYTFSTVTAAGTYAVTAGGFSTGNISLTLGATSTDIATAVAAAFTAAGLPATASAGVLLINGGATTISSQTFSGGLVGASATTVSLATTSADSISGGAGNDTINAGGGADTINGGAGNDTIVLTESTAAIDVIRFASSATNNGIDTITGAGTTDLINLNAFAGSTGTVTAVTGNLTPTASAVYYLATTANATDANTAAAAATALSAGAVWAAPSAAVTAYIVITDTNSTSVYSWTDVASSTDEVAAAELTLLGTIDAVIPSAGIGFGG